MERLIEELLSVISRYVCILPFNHFLFVFYSLIMLWMCVGYVYLYMLVLQ